ncbi:sensor histidine kinase [Pseudochryseolinea flava]|nr:ATP-binding protein [Pseudochryseolinea flava]
MRLTRVGIVVGLLLSCSVHAQEYRFKQYRVEQGLPSDVIKAIAEDSLGYFWIATDDGLVKYDGFRFTPYKSAFHSQYTKGFLVTKKGRLLAFGDLDLIEIKNLKDTVIFETLAMGTRNPTDSTIWFPKAAFEDRHGNIWLAEPQSLTRLSQNKLKRYDLGTLNRSTVFIRSFILFEDRQGILYAISYAGKLFRYDELDDRFEDMDVQLPEGVNHAAFYDDLLWFASTSGFYNLHLNNGEVGDVNMILPVENASHFCKSPDGAWWISTYGDDAYKLYPDQRLEALLYNFQGINQSYFSKEGDVWVATDKGVVLVQKNQFILADINSQAHFVEDIVYNHDTDVLYYCFKDNLIALKKSYDGFTWEGESVYNEQRGYFQSLQYGKRGLWASSATRVLLFVNEAKTREWNFVDDGNFVHDIFLDSKEDLWLSQAASNHIIVIRNRDLAVEKFDVPISNQSEVNVVREGLDGLYAGASGLNNYLFFKADGSNTFVNVSRPVTFNVEGDFNIVDIAIQGNTLWLASTEGLLKYDREKITRIDLGDVFTNFSVTSVALLDSANILFSNSHGLFRYNVQRGEYWLFDENAGLPSNTITDHGIYVDQKKRVWIGTSFGLATAVQPVINNGLTVKPVCVEARVNGVAKRFVDGLKLPYGAFVNFLFSAITFPENKIIMQWRMDHDSTWRVVRNHEVSITDLKPGKHTIEVRAKKNSGQGWSQSEVVTLFVDRPYWQHAEFVFLVLFICILIAWISYIATSRIMKKRKEYLQNLVQEKTHDLQKANEELLVRNTELDRFVYSASHDLSAPLKSILGLINVARLDKPNELQTQYLAMMERSVRKLEDFIRDVVSYSRNTRIPVRIEGCQFEDIVRNLLHDHQYTPNFEKITFTITDTTQGLLFTDLTRVKIILNNLISNAIKFHRFNDATIKPFVKISLTKDDANYLLTVEDNGSGIEAKHLDKIFEMFYRASEKSQGSGLGLYILKESVTKLNGTVEANSAIDQGSRFTITLPIPSVAPTV